MAVEAELLSLADVQAAADRIRPHIVATPTISGEAVAGAGVWLKAENLQRTGSFKVRGAVNAVLQLASSSAGAASSRSRRATTGWRWPTQRKSSGSLAWSSSVRTPR